MTAALIVAMDPCGVIGQGQTLPWRLPADLRRFRDLTMGKPVLMGRKTFESIGRPLPGRHLIILTRDPSFASPGCLTASDMEDAMRQANALTLKLGVNEWLVAGGAEIYAQALPRIDRLYLTLVDGQFAGDVFFPRHMIDPKRWQVTHAEFCPSDSKNNHSHAFVVLDRGANPEPITIPAPVRTLLKTCLDLSE